LKDLVPGEEIVPTLRPVLEAFRDDRRPGEGFGDYAHRVGISWLRRLVGAEPHAQSA
jgi:sulfite reductase (ferredoxin)